MASSFASGGSGRKPRPKVSSSAGLMGTLRARPYVLVVTFIVFGCCLAAGISAVFLVSKHVRDDKEDQAHDAAKHHATHLLNHISTLLHLAAGAAEYVAAGGGLNYTTVAALFPATAGNLLSEVYPQASNATLQLAPQGVVTAAQLASSAVAATSQLGFNWLATSDAVTNATLAAMAAGKLSLLGPLVLTSAADPSMVAMRPVFMSGVAASETFSQPAALASPPGNCPASLCYQTSTQTKFWGLVLAVTSLSSLVAEELSEIRDVYGYNYQLLTSVAVPGAAPASSSGWGGLFVLAKSADSLNSPMTAVVNVSLLVPPGSPAVQWTLALEPVSGWHMAWVTPCYVVVVVVSVLLALPAFFFLLARAQQELLLFSLVPPHMVAKLKENTTVGDPATDEFGINTPAEVILDLLSDCLNGRLPDSTTVVQLRATLLSLQDIYRPTDLNEQLKAADLDDEVADALYALVGKGGKNAAAPITGNDTSLQILTRTGSVTDGERPTFMRANSGSLGLSLDASGGSVANDLQAVLATLIRAPQDHSRRRASSIWHSGVGGDNPNINANGVYTGPAPVPPESYSRDGKDSSKQQNESSASQITEALLAADMSGPPVIQESALKASVRRLSNLLTFGTARVGRPDDQPNTPNAANTQNSQDLIASRQGSGNMMSSSDQQLQPIAPIVVEELNTVLEQAYSSWTYNAFALDDASRGRPLSVLAYFILHRTGLIKTLGLKPVKVARFLQALENSYMDNPYHCRIHAADVLQTFHVIITRGGFSHGYVDPIRHLACVIAAAAHDVEHEGLTNDYLINTESMLAMRYNDRSPMENHHLAAMYSILKHPAHNFISHFSREMRDTLRKAVIELVLGTDMKQHITITSQFKSVHKATIEAAEQAAAMARPAQRHTTMRSALSMKMLAGSFKNQVAAAPLSNGSITNVPRTPLDETERLLSLQVALKVADLGHLAEELEVHRRWVSGLEEEFFKQGDKEREKGLNISPLFDRNKPGVTKSQVGFFDFVAFPLFRTFTAVFPATQPMLECLEENYAYWKDVAEPAPGDHRAANASPSPPPLLNSKSMDKGGATNKVVAFSDHV